MSVLSRSNAANRNVRVSAVTLDSEFMFEFANWGTEPGQSTQPTAIAVGLDERVYLTDEYMQLLSVFAKDGTISHRRGEVGSSEGQWNRPSGLAFDSQGDLHVVDHLNARVQKYSEDGRYTFSSGTFGTGPGEFNYPWGISIDAEDCIWIVDWRNDRVQVFDMDGEHRETLVGHATLSKWCQEFLDVNPEQANWRANSGMTEQEKLFWRPAGIDTNSDGLVCIADSCRHRVQIYSRVEAPVLV